MKSKTILKSYEIVKFQVRKVWKGNVFKEMLITTPNYEGGCGYEFKVGKAYLIYARKRRVEDSNINLNTDIYTRTQELLEGRSIDLKLLGKGKKPMKSNP